MVDSDEDVTRLTAIIDQQRREIERLRAAAAVDQVVATARGALVERLGCSAAAAERHLRDLAAQARQPVAEIAAALLHEPSPSTPREGALEGLLAQAAALAAADGGELVAVLASQVAAQLGAAAVAVWLLAPDGGLDLLGEAGLGGAEASRWRRLPPRFDCPAQRVAAGGPDLWWPDGPPGGDPVPLIGGRPDGARVVAGLRRRADGLLGVLEACWPAPAGQFGADFRVAMSAICAGYAEVLEVRLSGGGLAAAPVPPGQVTILDELAGPVLAASAIRAADGSIADFRIEYVSDEFADVGGRAARDLIGRTLLGAYPSGGSGKGLFARALAVVSGKPDPAGQSGDDVRLARYFDSVIFSWHDQLGGGGAALLGNALRLGRIGGWEEDLAAGTTRWTDSVFGLYGLAPQAEAAIPLSDLHSFVIAADRPAVFRLRENLLQRQEPASAMFRIVRPDDGSLRQIRVFAEPVIGPDGSVAALRGAFQDVSSQYQTQVALAATRDRLADSEQRVAEEHQLAIRLQRAIMPREAHPVETAGIEVAVRYRPAGPGHLVGGDWYDALLLPTNEVFLAVGDIAGHGIDAVTGMVAARNTLRGLAVTGAGPAELVGLLNKAACQFSAGLVGTVVCGLYNPDTRQLRWARAGHLPPVLVRGKRADTLPLPGGVLLGMDPDGDYEEVETPLEPGDTLLLFTDGLIERRDVSISEALATFAAAAVPATGSAAEHAARLIDEASSDTGDDACLVAVRVS